MKTIMAGISLFNFTYGYVALMHSNSTVNLLGYTGVAIGTLALVTLIGMLLTEEK